MNKKMLVLAFAGLSMLAVAQSQSTETKDTPKASEVKSPRDLATGQASGKRAASAKSEPVTDADADGKAAGTKTGYNVKNATKARVAAGDVNGDGSNATAGAQTDLKSPRDHASGMPTGKRQHEPVNATTESDKPSKK